MQSRMIARRCAIPYALAHPARTRLNTEPVLPTPPERIEQSRPPALFQGAIAGVGWRDFTNGGGAPRDSFLAALIRIARRGRNGGAPRVGSTAAGGSRSHGTLHA